MGFLSAGRGAPAPASANWPQYTGLQLNVATNALPVPLIYGMTIAAGNIIYYNNFTPVPEFSPQQRAGKGSLLSGIFGAGSGTTWQQTGWTYKADVMLALCEGPIAGVNQVWQGQNNWLYSSSSPNPDGWPGLTYWPQSSSLFVGSETQAPWSYLSGVSGGIGYGSGGPGYSLSYPGTAYAAAAGWGLGESASLGTLRWEICALLYGTGCNGKDADPALVIHDFLTHPRHGARYPSQWLDLSWLLAAPSGPDSSVQTYCKAVGIAFSPNLQQFESASSILTRWLHILNVAAVRSGPWLRFIPYGDMNLQGNGVTWTAPVAPVYALDKNSFVRHEGQDPLTVDRADPTQLYNVQNIEVLNRSGVNVAAADVFAEETETLAVLASVASRGLSPGAGSYPQPQGQPQYEPTTVTARDLSQVDLVGSVRIAPVTSLHEICDLGVAATVAQTILQRGLYVRASFKFTLPWQFCLLDPMDVVTISDPNLGLSNVPVRIIAIDEDDNGELRVTAEEMPRGVSTPGPNITAGSASAGANAAVPPDPMQTYLIWEPPGILTNGAAQIWIGASGGSGGVPDPNWGGAYVLVSIDGGTTYAQCAKITAPLKQGVLTANYPSAAGFDTADTISVNVTATGAQLLSTSDANAQQGLFNLCLVGQELLAYATATLTSANNYAMTRIQRGAYGSTPASHSIGDELTQLDNMVKSDTLPLLVGATLYFKFQSFNIYGGAVEDLSSLTAYPYVVQGSGYNGSNQEIVSPPAPTTLSGASATSTTVIPINGWVVWIKVTVTTAMTGATSINIDPQYLPDGSAGGSSGAYGNIPAALGSTTTINFTGTVWHIASGLKFTAVGGTFSGGVVAATVQYITVF